MNKVVKGFGIAILRMAVAILLATCGKIAPNDRNSAVDEDKTDVTSSSDLPVAVSGVNLVTTENPDVRVTKTGPKLVAVLQVINDAGTRVDAEGFSSDILGVVFSLESAAGKILVSSEKTSATLKASCAIAADGLSFTCDETDDGASILVALTSKSGKAAKSLKKTPPLLSGVTAVAQRNGGYLVAITGSGFDGSTPPEVTVAGVACGTFSVATSTQLECVLASGTAGAAVLLVTNPDGGATSSASLLVLPPKRLSAFSVVPGNSPGELALSWTYNSGATASYTALEIRRAAGGTAPSSCTEGTLITTISDFATTTYTDTGTASASYSYLLCLTGSSGTTGLDTASGTAAAGSCGGYSSGGYCWYLSATGDSCDQACSTHGAANLVGIRDHVGSGAANVSQCLAIAAVLAPTIVTGMDTSSCGALGQTGVGCHFLPMPSPSQVLRCTGAVTTTTAFYTAIRLCACNN